MAPDLITTAKSMAGGFPISGVVGRAEVMDAPAPGGLGGTYAGSPLGCAAALAVLQVFEEEQLLARAQALGERLMAGLRAIAAKVPAIGDVRGLGAMVAIELCEDGDLQRPDAELTRRVVAEAARRGLILLSCGSHGNVIRILVPLTAPDALVDEGLHDPGRRACTPCSDVRACEVPPHAPSPAPEPAPAAPAARAAGADALVRFAGVQKTYDGVQLVVRQLDLDIRRGEFLTLLGPSGSGKTTTLMMLAGFESPTAGEILLDGKPITRTPPHKRNFGMVFQNYALFPHLTVGQNVAYPLDGAQGREGGAGAACGARARAWCGWRAWPSASRRSSPAASSSAWRWRARWCSSRSWC